MDITLQLLIRKVKQAKNFQVPNPDQPKIQPTVPRHKDYISQKLNEKSSTTIWVFRCRQTVQKATNKQKNQGKK